MSTTIFEAHTLDEVPGNLSISMAIPCMNPTVAPTHLLILFKWLLITSQTSLSWEAAGVGKRLNRECIIHATATQEPKIISGQHRQQHLKHRQKQTQAFTSLPSL